MSALAEQPSESDESGGIRAEIQLADLRSCPVAQVSKQGVECFNVSKRVDPETGRVTEEFATDADLDGESGLDPVFSYGNQSVYRFQRTFGHDCACELVEEYDCPIVDVQAQDGDLTMVFHAPSMDELRGAVTALRESFPNVDVKRLVSSRDEDGSEDLVFVDRGVLTDRQREVLETAHELGYFQHPKGANAGEVADELGITTSTFTEHLAAAQSKLLDAILEEPEPVGT
ncbi:bacterio-opsin activator HTH domain-containing protein [Halodesulfurarchaeum formicicum]|uniref:Bacterio-opsin activator HTH domain-containing protein n=1 Tax=Halodesulfurarchaeum formicicum TaxID=1873524 RepID=A0A1D8S1M2_9EURY|nr:helix-turn-helix domain-containing protein [Halodesulfurarchaeum formicicum]AOW79266.1 bacterio-opsin activator HTH domain-containing protein [Halodesulfurarchaeum formicicum]APE94532.1 bacterio-opsin activator HTH domain-containing protein [Halodesulfurarchaeum formicicum]